MLVGYYYTNKTNILLLFNDQQTSLWTSTFECRRKGTVADDRNIGAIKLLSHPIFNNGTATFWQPAQRMKSSSCL